MCTLRQLQCVHAIRLQEGWPGIGEFEVRVFVGGLTDLSISWYLRIGNASYPEKKQKCRKKMAPHEHGSPLNATSRLSSDVPIVYPDYLPNIRGWRIVDIREVSSPPHHNPPAGPRPGKLRVGDWQELQCISHIGMFAENYPSLEDNHCMDRAAPTGPATSTQFHPISATQEPLSDG